MEKLFIKIQLPICDCRDGDNKLILVFLHMYSYMRGKPL